MSNWAQKHGDRHEADGSYDEPQGRGRRPVSLPDMRTVRAVAAQREEMCRNCKRKKNK